MINFILGIILTIILIRLIPLHRKFKEYDMPRSGLLKNDRKVNKFTDLWKMEDN